MEDKILLRYIKLYNLLKLDLHYHHEQFIAISTLLLLAQGSFYHILYDWKVRGIFLVFFVILHLTIPLRGKTDEQYTNINITSIIFCDNS